jgi:hypothetical protein
MKLSKFTMLNFIGDVFEPRYHDGMVLIACSKVDRSRLDIKLRFPKVSETSEYAGDWFISRKKAKSYRKKFNNNGLNCYAIPFEAFEPLIIDRSLDREYSF